MKDLDLGPQSRGAVERFDGLDRDQRPIARKAEELYDAARTMSDLLRKWLDDSWCWPDASPARICGGPHVKVIYKTNDRVEEVIEHKDHVGEMFPGVEYAIKS